MRLPIVTSLLLASCTPAGADRAKHLHDGGGFTCTVASITDSDAALS